MSFSSSVSFQNVDLAWKAFSGAVIWHADKGTEDLTTLFFGGPAPIPGGGGGGGSATGAGGGAATGTDAGASDLSASSEISSGGNSEGEAGVSFSLVNMSFSCILFISSSRLLFVAFRVEISFSYTTYIISNMKVSKCTRNIHLL